MKKILLVLFLFICIKINASVIVIDAESGRILYGSNINEKKLIASTTKIMTSIVALENGNLNDKYKVGKEIYDINGSMIYIKENEIISLNDLLYGLLLQSGNDAAVVIANNVLNYSEFINQMNKKAISLGMNNTTFENPHGLNDDTKNYSTAYDLSILMKYAINNPKFMKISGTKKYKTKTNETEYIWYNKNKLLSMYKYSTSGKIGFTKASGQVFVSSATKNNKKLIIVSIDESNKFELHKNLYEKYFKLYNKYKLLNSYTFSLNDSRYKKYYIYINKDINVLLKENEIKDVNIVAKLNNKFENNIAGSINIYLKDKLVAKEKLFYTDYNKRKSKIKKLLF